MSAGDLLDALTEPQRAAVMHTEGPLLVLAGAGSGKTRVITRRAAYIARTVARPEEVLAITFTNKAAGEMRERIHTLGVGGRMWVCTFHSLCARLLREYGPAVGVQTNFSIFDQSDSRGLVRQAVRNCDLHVDNWPPRFILAQISRAKMQLKTPDSFSEEATDYSSRAAARVYHEYQRLLVAQNACDFDDLMMHVARLLGAHAEIRRELSDRFRYILVDEYQDTNHAQYLIASRLASAHRNLCATGDPDQSIYAWRGADLHNILDFEADYADARVVRLERNFRSTGAILSAASRLISANVLRKRKDLWTEDGWGIPVGVWTCDDEHVEAERIAGDVQQYCEAGGQPGDVAVFYRINALTRVLEDAFRKAGLPYQIARGVEFYARKEIKDVLAYLRAIVNPSDETALLRAINTPARGIGKVTIERLEKYALNLGGPLDRAIAEAEQYAPLKTAWKKIRVFADLLRTLRGLPESPVRPIVEAVIRESGLEKSLVDSSDIDDAAMENVFELVTAAREFDQENPGGTLGDWLHQISLVSDTDTLRMTGGAVTMMTLHAAKGLEFPVVYIAGLEDGLLPHRRALQGEDAGVEEERRLFFVGITRAMRRITISHAKYRMVRGINERANDSRFLGELPADEIERRLFLTERDRSRSHLGRHNLDEAPIDDTMYYPGLQVKHDEYGIGRVIRLEPRGRSVYIRILFRDHGERSFALEHVPLYILEN